MQQICAILAAVLLAAGCTSPDSSTYGAGDVGQIIETTEGTVVSSRIVDVKGGDDSNVGIFGGGAAGATAGYTVAGGGRGSGLATVLGALLGAGVGYMVEESARSREGIEYVIRMSDGRVVTLVQNRDGEEEPLPNGAPVLVQYGGDYTRVVATPEGVESGSGGGGAGTPGGKWKNPDAPPPEEATPDPGLGGSSDEPQTEETQ